MSAWCCEGCGNEVTGKIRRGRCENCYRKHLKQCRELGQHQDGERRKYRPTHGSVASAQKRLGVVERTFMRTTPAWGGCILWTGYVDRDGYAIVKVDKQTKRAHRQIYLHLVGAIPDGLVLDHICHSTDANCPGGDACMHRRCVNPRHLETVTQAENNKRGLSVTTKNSLKTHCIRGHEFTPENTILSKRLRQDGTPHRSCRPCRSYRPDSELPG